MPNARPPTLSAPSLGLLWAALLAIASVGILGRGYWTPDEPREADLAWRMSWQAGKAVPLLAGEPFCEKPPLTYWVAGAAIGLLGNAAWTARLPNLIYALATALAVGWIGRRAAGPLAGLTAAAAISTFLLSYQVTIWLATDAPLLAAVAMALLGLHVGFYARTGGERLRGYSGMHAALALGFLAKSAAAWMVPALTLISLVIWERRWRELLRWELYAGLGLQAVLILPWIRFVYAAPDGPAHLQVFFWNNLVGRFVHVAAPADLQYAAAHRNSPGKYLTELPVYLWPWTLLVIAAARRAWIAPTWALPLRQDGRMAHSLDRPPRVHDGQAGHPLVARPLLRFAVATSVPTLGVLSFAATARNIYLAPALPGAALLLGWWAATLIAAPDRWDLRALRGTTLLLLLAAIVIAAAATIVGMDSWSTLDAHTLFVAASLLGVACAAAATAAAWRAWRRQRPLSGLYALLLAYCALLAGPASQIYRCVDAWQDLAAVGRAVGRDAAGRPLILFAPDETTRAFIDMYARTSVQSIPGPISQSADRLGAALASHPRSLVLTQLAGRSESPVIRTVRDGLGLGRAVSPTSLAEVPSWAAAAQLRTAHVYALPNGRRYALLDMTGAAADDAGISR